MWTINENMKVGEYRMVQGANPEYFSTACNKLIEQGFQPYGQPFQLQGLYAQAFVCLVLDI